RSGALTAEIAQSRQRISARDAAREALARERVIDSYEKIEDAAGRWQARQEEQDALVRQARDRRTQRGEAKDAGHAEARELSAEHARVLAEFQSATAILERALSWRDQLQRCPALGEVQGVDVADLEQPRLEQSLRKHADDARRRILELSV